MYHLVGEVVYVPNAYTVKWESHMTRIKRVYKDENGIYKYYVDCPIDRLTNNDPPEIVEKCYKEHQIFVSRKDCDEYIDNYYYDGLCRGCKYDKINAYIATCGDCEYMVNIPRVKPTDNYIGKCKLTNITVSSKPPIRQHECCKYYKPTLSQNKKAYVSWEYYEDMLINCEFNKKCICHTKSCHKTCTYDWYMNYKRVAFPISFEFNGRKVWQAKVTRRVWIEQSFLNGDILECLALTLVPELTKTGRKKKGSVDFVEFDKPTKINIKTGEIVV